MISGTLCRMFLALKKYQHKKDEGYQKDVANKSTTNLSFF
jgi:hypothetical protein